MKEWLLLIITTIFLLPLLLPSVVYSGEYYQIEKSRYTDEGREDICEILVNNFNRFKDEEPMVCDLKFHPDFKNFSLPAWKKIDALKNFETIKRLQTKESSQPWNDTGIEMLKKRLKNGKYKLFSANIDINHDSHVNTAYKLTTEKCDVDRNYKYSYAGYSKYYAEPNFPDKEHPKGLGRFNGSVLGTLFFYKGRMYYHTWKQWPIFLSQKSRAVEGPSPRIAIYETTSPFSGRFESFAFRERCEIGYRK